MKRMTQMAGALLIAAATVACGADDRAANNADANRPNDAAVGTSGMAGGDRDWIADQLEDGMAEIELGRLAQQRATNPRVKEFAAMMVEDHTKAGAELKSMAVANTEGNAQAARPEEMNNDHKNLREDLAKLDGAEFDRKYMEAMVEEHEEAVDELKGKANDSNDSVVKQWAAKSLPVVQQHLEHARELQKSLDGDNNTAGAKSKARDHK